MSSPEITLELTCPSPLQYDPLDHHETGSISTIREETPSIMERVIVIIVLLAAVALAAFSFLGPKPQGSTSTAREATFTLTEYAITPNRITLANARVKLVFKNDGNIAHGIEIYDTVEQRVIAKIDYIRPKSTATPLWIELTGGRRYQLYDPTWRRRGMEALIIVP